MNAPGESDDYHVPIESPRMPCLCGGHFWIGINAEDVAYIIHTEPLCPAFEAVHTERDIHEYSARNRGVS